MSAPVRVLLVEDSPEESEILLAELRRGGYLPVARRVDGPEAMRQALEEQSWDAVLSEYRLEGFDAFSALAIVKECDPDLPVLLVSRTIGEETAVRAIKAGVHNCIPKDSLDRLAPTLDRELREARIRRERRQAQRALRESEARFRTLAETAPDAILLLDEALQVLFVNGAAERIFGHPAAAMIARSIRFLIPGEEIFTHRDAEAYREGSEPKVVALTGRRADGAEIPLEVSFGGLTRESRRLFTLVARDVSYRRAAEDALRQSEERFRIAAQSSSDLIYDWDVASGRLDWFGRIDEILGYGPGEFPRTLRAWEEILHPDDRERVLAGVILHQKRGAPFQEQYRVVRRDGVVLVWTDSGRALSERSGKSARWIGTITDVTERRSTEYALAQSEGRLRALVDNAPVVLFAVGRDGIVTHSEGKGLEALGLKPGEAVGRSVAEMLSEVPDGLTHLRRALAGEPVRESVEVRGLTFDVQFAPTFNAERACTGVIGVATDVTEKRRAELAAHVSELRYRSLFQRNLAGVYRTTLDGRILDCNDSFARIFGYASREEVLSHPAWDFYLSAEDRKAALARLKEWQTLTNYETCLRRKDGSPVWVLENGSLVEGPDGHLSHIEGTLIDISERKQAEEQVKHLAFHDGLTGLPNRLLFQDRLTVAVGQAQRGPQKLATLFLDLDRFKVINDSLGHSIGDELLRCVALRVQACVRAGDTVARLGGDEFTVLVSGISAEEDAAKVARKILEEIRLPFSINGRELFLSTSIGVAVYPTDGEDAETLVRNADIAMYRAKEQGRDNYQLYTPAMNVRALERLSLESRLRQALQNAELVLHYQPVVDLRSGKIRGAEALVRWQHPEMGLVPPGEFIPLAEVSGLIVPIGLWVLQTACAQARQWHQIGFPDLAIAVNLSSRQFQQTDLVQQVTGALESSGLEPVTLDLEITESNAMQNAEISINTLQDLKSLGVSLSMDDFGTGYSSLSYLKRFPIDRIKIDKSFVRDVSTDPDDAAIAAAVIAMAHSLELGVVAEGVETEEQLAFLRQNRCDEMQGFLFSRPVPAEEFERVLAKNRKPGRISRPRVGSAAR